MSNRSIYRKIAKQNGISMKEVKIEMQAALEYAFTSNDDSIIKAYQEQVPRRGEVPTPEEFIKYAVNNQISKIQSRYKD